MAKKISFILSKNDGVIKVDFPEAYFVEVTFNDNKTNASQIVNALKRAKLSVKGKPKFIKKKPSINNNTKN